MIDTIVNSFEIWTKAQGIKSRTRINSVENISLEGILQLRELILKLALMGKLVPQDKTDEHASKLLDHINQEKNNLVKKGVIKKEKSFLQIESNEIPYFLPDGWVWCRLADISVLINGDRGKNYPSKEHYILEGIPFITAANLGDRFLKYDSLNYISEDRFALLNSGQIESNDILYCLRGSLGKCAIVDRINKGAIASSLCIVRSLPGINHNFILNYFLSPIGKEMIKRHDNGTAQPNLSATDVKTYVFPLPPLAEQHRIVAKVDELMALCDKLESEQFKNLKTHQVLVKTLLETLTQATDANELGIIWERISEHFDTLFYTEDSIDQLKQSIRQLAVMGKLVKQDPNDEPASELIKRIEKEKERLVKEGKIKKQTSLVKINEDEKPFELPKGWEWTRLGKIGIGSTGKTPSTNILQYFGGDIPFIGPGQITPEGNIIEADKTLTNEGIEYSTIAEVGDLIMVCIGGTIGKCAIIKFKTAFNQQINCIRPLFFDTHFLYDIMNATYFQQSILSKATGSATPIINRSKWEEILIPVPSLSEQIRIVQKIEELFTLCESLKTNIKKSEELKVLLSKTIIEKAVE